MANVMRPAVENETRHRLVCRLLCLWLLVLGADSLLAADSNEFVFEQSDATLTALEWSPASPNGETILAIPWLGGAASGYRYVGPLLADAGYRVVAINPRGIDGSSGLQQGLTLRNYANDIVAVASELGLERFHIMGWAWGNRLARTVATDHPDLVDSVILIAAGGAVPPLADMAELGRLSREPDLPLSERVALARDGLFAPVTPAALIEEYIDYIGDWADGTAGERAAAAAIPVEHWWSGGEAPMLIVQGLNDRTAPPENGEIMKRDYGDRITLVNLQDAGHMMGLEKPQETAQAIIAFLRTQ
jgi:pimeloyl-ACP methyl ester carboxylesterase